MDLFLHHKFVVVCTSHLLIFITSFEVLNFWILKETCDLAADSDEVSEVQKGDGEIQVGIFAVYLNLG